MTIVRGLRVVDSNTQTGTTWWNWTDSYFPEPMWGAKQRESELDLPSFKVFFTQLGGLL